MRLLDPSAQKVNFVTPTSDTFPVSCVIARALPGLYQHFPRHCQDITSTSHRTVAPRRCESEGVKR